MNRSFLLLFTALVLFIGAKAIYILPEGQQSLITQFGKPVGEVETEAGIKFIIPIVQEPHFFEKRVLQWDGEPNEIPTNDKTFIWVDTTARWRIENPLLFMQRLKNVERAKLVLNDLIDGSVRDFVTKNNLIEVIRSSDWKPEYSVTTERGGQGEQKVKVGRDRFSQLVLESVAQVTKSYGIEMLDVLVKRINYTNSVRETVYQRMISERKRIAAQKRSFGEGQKAEILGTVERELNVINSEAYKKSQVIRGKADAEATKIYGDAFSVDPDFYSFYTTLDTYKEVMKKNSKLIIDTKSPLYRYLKSVK